MEIRGHRFRRYADDCNIYVLWRQWKKPHTGAQKLVEHGVEKVRAYTSAYND